MHWRRTCTYLSSAIFYYFCFAKKSKNYLANRVVFDSILLAWTIPSISYMESVSGILPTIRLEAITLSPNALADSPTVLSFSFQQVMVTIYALGVVVGSLIFIKRFLGAFLFTTGIRSALRPRCAWLRLILQKLGAFLISLPLEKKFLRKTRSGFLNTKRFM